MAKNNTEPDDVFDLDAVVDDRPPFHFRFGGHEFTFPGDPDILWIDMARQGAYHECLRVLLGPEQFKALDGLDVVFSQRKFDQLLERYAGHLGVDLGKSSGPSRSSATTRRR